MRKWIHLKWFEIEEEAKHERFDTYIHMHGHSFCFFCLFILVSIAGFFLSIASIVDLKNRYSFVAKIGGVY